MTRTLIRPWSYFPLGLRAYRDTFRFTGRARRLEVAEFYIVSMFLGLIFRLVSDFGLHIEGGSPAEGFLATRVVEQGLQLLPILPLFALTARRIQDFDLPGWLFSPLMLYVFAVNGWKFLAAITAYQPPSLWGSLAFLVPAGSPSAILQFLQIPIVMAMLIAWFIPGSPGPNRYGPNPRHASASQPA